MIITTTSPNDVDQMSLRLLSETAANIWFQLSEISEEDGAIEEMIAKLLLVQEATASKVDALAWIAEHLENEIEIWKTKKQNAASLFDNVIVAKEKQLEGIKAGILALYKQGLISENLLGMERKVSIHQNPPRVEMLVEIDDEEFPEEFKETHVEVKANKKAILDAHKAGVCIDRFAEIKIGSHVRFKNLTSNDRKRGSK